MKYLFLIFFTLSLSSCSVIPSKSITEKFAYELCDKNNNYITSITAIVQISEYDLEIERKNAEEVLNQDLSFCSKQYIVKVYG